MSLLFRVLYAVHATGTHHKLAFDGLRRLEGPQAEAWRRVFLKHADVLMIGAKAPDDSFKDFKNHVLHPRDDFWGGAPVKAREWYNQTVDALTKEDWQTAAYAAGVLSHYVTDPGHPFHTAQSEAENCIHRAFEWSTAKSYDALKAIANADARREIAIPDADNWLERLICEAANAANAHYEKLIAHYDINRGVVDPPSGLDDVARRIVGELIGCASALFATILQHAITASKATPPDVNLTLDTVLATLKIPAKLLLKRIADTGERRLIERMYDELKATGTVEENLPADDRMVRDLHKAEVVAKRPTVDGGDKFPRQPRDIADQTIDRRAGTKRMTMGPVPRPVAPVTPVEGVPSVAPIGREVPVQEPPRPAPRAVNSTAPLPPVVRRTDPIASTGPVIEKAPPSLRPQVTAPVAVTALPPKATPAPIAPVQTLAAAIASVGPPAAHLILAPTQPALTSGPRIYLTPAHDIVDAPSIGPRMAERLRPLGFKTVADLLNARPEVVAEKLELREVDAAMVRDWQDQSRLVCTVPALRGTHAQLLIGAGYRTAAAIAATAADKLCADILAFAASANGMRVLRQGDPPDIEKIKSWLDNARSVQVA